MFHLFTKAYYTKYHSNPGDLRPTILSITFGIPRAHFNFNQEKTTLSALIGVAQFAFQIDVQFRDHTNTIASKIRHQFDALIKQFLDSAPMNNAITDFLEFWRLMVAKRNALAIPGDTTVADEAEITSMFLKNDLELVSDVWAPVLSCFPKGYITTTEGAVWGQYLYQYTATIMIHLLTAIFKSKNHDEIFTDMSLLATPIKNAAIAKADAVPKPNGWPPIEMTNSRYTAAKPKTFNKLNGSCVTEHLTVPEIDCIITDQNLVPDSEHAYPLFPEISVPPNINNADTKTLFEYLMKRVNKNMSNLAAEQLCIQTQQRDNEDAIQKMTKWVHYEYEKYNQFAELVNSQVDIERFIREAKAEFELAV
ncbi:hypothetical protein L211DRAFT_854146 [Terfezia boudieri ATCC MYA-4762]|uniref:Uncharacterized protein n=1 Tax=Terfezia boudieri ATCC MYA-4762 TaxID=1051890 RepID=A0A3N4LAA2_9PEZI|nr:hypothetical protein L211DRAFT_854146 [Terfezia boudieri ATCC MYA-4762]